MIHAETPKFFKVFPFLYFKGSLSHGWFGVQNSVKGHFLHQKSFYARLGKPNSKLQFNTGFIHHVQWAGIPRYKVEGNEFAVNGKFASGFNTFKGVIFPLSNPAKNNQTASFDYENRYGNHLGQIDFSGYLNLNKISILAYKQIPFETGQTFSSWTNIDDGLYGLSFILKKSNQGPKRFNFEFLNTTNQGFYRAGLLRLLGYEGKHYGQNRNFYFNHGQYRDGWAYQNMGLGTPFLAPSLSLRNEKQVFITETFANNNMVKAGYISLYSQRGRTSITHRASYSVNYGSPALSLEKVKQISYAVLGDIKGKRNDFHFGIGIDQGDLIKDNYSVLFSWERKLIGH
jgi:hypothetical protein